MADFSMSDFLFSKKVFLTMVFRMTLFWFCILGAGFLSDAQSECHEEESLLQIQPKDKVAQLELDAKTKMILAADNDGSESVTEEPFIDDDAAKMGVADEEGGFSGWEKTGGEEGTDPDPDSADIVFDEDAEKMGTADEEGGFSDWENSGGEEGEDPEPDADDWEHAVGQAHEDPNSEEASASLWWDADRRRRGACGWTGKRRRRCCEHRRRTSTRRRDTMFRRRESPICKDDLCVAVGSIRRRQCDDP